MQSARAGGEGAAAVAEARDGLGLAIQAHRAGGHDDRGAVGDLIAGQPPQRTAINSHVASNGIHPSAPAGVFAQIQLAVARGREAGVGVCRRTRQR